MTHHAMDQGMQACIDACQQCHNICLQAAMTQCLHMGGKHVEAEHIRLMINCSEICQTAANFMLSQSALHSVICAACAQVCHACATNCEQVGDMDECVQACRRCAEACEEMGAGTAMPHGQGAAQQAAH